MKKLVKLFFVFSLILIILIFLIINIQEPSEPKEFVKNRTVTNYSNLFFIYEISRYPSNVEIRATEKMNENITLGFVIESWNLNFGIIPGNGTFVKRNVEISNKEESSMEIIFRSYGNISPLVFFSKNNFILNPDEKVAIDIFLFSNKTKEGNYSGEIDLISKKPIYNFLSIK